MWFKFNFAIMIENLFVDSLLCRNTCCVGKRYSRAWAYIIIRIYLPIKKNISQTSDNDFEAWCFRKISDIDRAYWILIEQSSFIICICPTLCDGDNNPSNVFARMNYHARMRYGERPDRIELPSHTGLNGLTSHFNIEMPQHTTNEPPGHRPYETKQ